MEKAIVIHYSEIATKGKNRKFFEDRLIKNLKMKLGKGFSVEKRYGKVLIFGDLGERERLKEILAFTPGVVNYSFSWVCENNFESLKSLVLEYLENSDWKAVESFAIESQRSWKKFEKKSMQINREIGALVQEKTRKEVDLDRPDKKIYIEVGEKECLIYEEKFSGVGGLPIGTLGKLLCSISGGIDSPVAAYQMMKRGCKVDLIFFENQTINTAQSVEKIRQLAKTLADVQGQIKLIIVPFGEIQRQIVEKCPADYRMLVYRRAMQRIAEKVCISDVYKGIVTGDNVGQVASQTLENTQVIDEATKGVVYRPVVSMNKEEIIEVAQKIGTYDTSVEPFEDCCSYMISKSPQTKARLRDVLKIEEDIDFSLLDKAVKDSKEEKFAISENQEVFVYTTH